MATTVYQMVTDRIIEQINKGIVPWHKPWHFAGNASTSADVAINYVSRKPYSLLNQWLLMEPGEYITFTQIKGLGGSLKKGAKSRFVVFFTKATYKTIDPKTNEEKEETYPLLRYYNVYRLADTEGIKSKLPAPGEAPEIVETPAMCDEADAAMLCSNFGVDTDKAFRNSVAYLQSWVANLKNDPKAIVVAASRAEKAARYILGERETAQA